MIAHLTGFGFMAFG